MNLLWQIVQDDSKVEQSIADAALNQLCKVLATYNLRTHRNMLIQTFCDHIRNRVSVHQSIVLLQKVLRTCSSSHSPVIHC
jgi:aminoglycoside phosphotransferase family enzyme